MGALWRRRLLCGEGSWRDIRTFDVSAVGRLVAAAFNG
jgi:hypothetical protein